MTNREIIDIIDSIKKDIKSEEKKADFNTIIKLFTPQNLGGIGTEHPVYTNLHKMSWEDVKNSINAFKANDIIYLGYCNKYGVITQVDGKRIHTLWEDGEVYIKDTSASPVIFEVLKQYHCDSLINAIEVMGALVSARDNGIAINNLDDEHGCCGDKTDKSHCGQCESDFCGECPNNSEEDFENEDAYEEYLASLNGQPEQDNSDEDAYEEYLESLAEQYEEAKNSEFGGYHVLYFM